MPVVVATEVLLDDPTDRVGITITGLGIGDSVVTVWRLADGERVDVPGYRRELMNDGAYLEDVYAPLQRPVSYEVEVISGPMGASRTTSDSVVVPATTGWLMDAIVPETAVRVVGKRNSNDDIYLRGPALSELEFQTDVSLFKIMGNRKPMALFGERMAAKGVDTSVGTRSAEENTRLFNLLESTGSLHFRPLPEWGDVGLKGSVFLANPVAKLTPVNVLIGGNLRWWDIKSDVVGGPAIKILTATFTYGDVELLMDTYQQKQDLMADKTYIEDLKNPLGG